MSSRAAHEMAGAIAASAICTTLNQDLRKLLLELTISVPLGKLGGRLPDILEPSLNNPNHRQFFHSLAFMFGAGVIMKKLFEWEPYSMEGKAMRWGLLIVGAAYMSHLLLDSSTPKSLPLFGKI